MPDFHKLNKTRTTEMSKEELNRRLREEVGKSAAKSEKLAKAQRSAENSRTARPAGKAAPAQKKKQRK